MHEYAAWQRENLRFVLQTSEGSREDQTVIIALKLCTVVASLLHILLSEAFARGYQLLPVHHILGANIR